MDYQQQGRCRFESTPIMKQKGITIKAIPETAKERLESAARETIRLWSDIKEWAIIEGHTDAAIESGFILAVSRSFIEGLKK